MTTSFGAEPSVCGIAFRGGVSVAGLLLQPCQVCLVGMPWPSLRSPSDGNRRGVEDHWWGRSVFGRLGQEVSVEPIDGLYLWEETLWPWICARVGSSP